MTDKIWIFVFNWNLPVFQKSLTYNVYYWVLYFVHVYIIDIIYLYFIYIYTYILHTYIYIYIYLLRIFIYIGYNKSLYCKITKTKWSEIKKSFYYSKRHGHRTLKMKLLEKEQQLLEKLRQTIVQADINSKQAAKSACYGIEKTIAILHGRRRQLQDAWEGRKKLLEQSVKSGKLDEEFKKVY